MPGSRPTPERKKTIKEKRLKKVKMVVKEYHMDPATKQWSPWITGTKAKKTQTQHSEQNLLECALGLQELFAPDQMNKQAVKGREMKETKSSTMKKGPDEERKKLSTMAKEQGEQMRNTRKKLGQIKTLKKPSWRRS